MLFPLVESCLPAEILRAWERYVGYSSDESGKKDLDSLMKFLSIEVSSEDRIKLARNSFDSKKSNYKNKLGNLSTTATAADLFNSNFKNRKDFKFKNNNNNCIFCEKAHASENCCEAASMLYEVKKNAVIKRGVCYICLKKGHMSHSCRSDVKCIICNKRHYAVLCSKLPLRSGLETESASIENSTTASSSSSNVLANQACTSEVLLQTLVVMLQNGNHKSLAVIKENSTSKMRPVFDASARTKGSPSLNDCLEKGPNFIEVIPTILNRFRKYKIGVISDIEKAFLQIGVREQDRDFLRFMWYDRENRDHIKIYRHRRVVFGVTSSPFLLGATLNHHLDNAHGNFDNVAKILRKSFYVDNCVTSFETEEQLQKFIVESKILLSFQHILI
ncbi:uncharacterized protein TNCV_1418491 [Trichonephila clavipes]|nr:uncharacterized protein TNCV_1418491 [Trichonephila clavipes]